MKTPTMIARSAPPTEANYKNESGSNYDHLLKDTEAPK